jgi:leucyl/phenylalanyl-tRNA---protein transferase
MPALALSSSFMGRSRFLNPELAGADGLVGVGGELTPDWLLDAYRQGVFPYYDETSPILWWSPNPRGIFELNAFHVSRRLDRTVRSNKFQLTVNADFAGVMTGCGDRPGPGGWILPEMIDAYTEMHRLGHAHSVEVWHQGNLAGGVYGVAVGGVFAGESMFTRVRDASKVALMFLVDRLRQRGYRLFDIQFVTPHTASLGAIAIPRKAYLKLLREALLCPATFV